jgi:hypothetical protein
VVKHFVTIRVECPVVLTDEGLLPVEEVERIEDQCKQGEKVRISFPKSEPARTALEDIKRQLEFRGLGVSVRGWGMHVRVPVGTSQG